MRIDLHIGLQHCGAARMQSVLHDKRDLLLGKGTLFASSPGNRNHTRLFMAVSDVGNIDTLRFNRGYITAAKQQVLRDTVAADLAHEVAQHAPQRLILSCSQLCWLRSKPELERLKALLVPLSNDIRIIAHVDDPAALMARLYGGQILEGRGRDLRQELGLLAKGDWWQAALATVRKITPQAGVFAEVQGAPHWLDFAALVTFWESVFGTGKVALHSIDAPHLDTPEMTDDICRSFDVKASIGKAAPAKPVPPPSAASLARGRQLNALILQVLANGKRILPRQLWRGFVQDIAIDGPALDAAPLAPLSQHFAASIAALRPSQPGLAPPVPYATAPPWAEADPLFGFRASQYLLGYMWQIDKATRKEKRRKNKDLADSTQGDPALTPAAPEGLSPVAARLLPPLAVQNFEKLRTSSFAPHNRMGSVDETAAGAPYAPRALRTLPQGSTGTVIIACMKNEAPYIVEWIAYHRAIGVDHFVIYTNDCSDGTAEILNRLDAMGIVQHRANDDWKGKSPQQAALNNALHEPVVKNADWLIHIDVDEFINIRTGNGTLQDFFDVCPDATSVAMTWRMFGNNGVTRIQDAFVVDQFDRCAPSYCPKPHTVWGFKTMFRNTGAYAKMSCHRPNKLDPRFRGKVKWVNGSGKDMTREAAEKGWRSSKRSVGYDLIQLNHYALRSADSYLIKRQRGRALHVDRSIGINYWIRMDWSDHQDITIKRNLPRLRAEYDRLMADATLRSWHEHGIDWHLTKAEELHQTPEFADLYKQALTIDLTPIERVAYALALDMES